MRGQYEVRDDVVWCWDSDGDVLQVAPVGVQEGGAASVLAPAHLAVCVPGLAPAAQQEAEQQEHPVCDGVAGRRGGVTLTGVRQHQSQPPRDQRPTLLHTMGHTDTNQSSSDSLLPIIMAMIYDFLMRKSGDFSCQGKR